MQKLNLPDCDLRIKQEEGNTFVFDIVRKKDVVLTPEEWVRQHFIHLLIEHLKYPKSMIRLESGLIYFKLSKRSDILIHDRAGDPFLIIECKAPEVKINKKVVNQVAVYNKIITARFLAVTNGLQTFIWKLENGKYVSCKDFPEFPEL